MPKWTKLYNFNNKYQPNCVECLIINGMNKLRKNNSLAQLFKNYYAVGNLTAQPINTDPKAWPYYWCGISHFTISAYDNCLRSFH